MEEYEPAYFEETRRGFQKLIYDGYVFVSDFYINIDSLLFYFRFAYTMDRKSMKTSNWKCAVFTR